MNSVVREMENRRVGNSRRGQRFSSVVRERPKSRSIHRNFSEERERRVREVAQTQEHLTIGESAAQRKRGDVSLHMEANNRRRAEGTCRQAKSFAL